MSAADGLSLDVLGQVEVDVSVLLGTSTVLVRDILAFSPGTVLPLDSRADAPVRVLVNAVPVATGDIVELEDGSLAVEIRSVAPASAPAECA